MGPFDPPDSPVLPPAIRAYTLAMRAWVDSGWSLDDPAGAALERACGALRRELERQGGTWRVGGLVYCLEGGGIAIEQETAPAEPGAEAGDRADNPEIDQTPKVLTGNPT